MATISQKNVTLFILAAFAYALMVHASDPDILSDFIVPENTNVIDGKFFAYTGLRGAFDFENSTTYKGVPASLKEFPALNGQSVSMAVLQFPPNAINPPHTRPHSTGLLLLIDGSLEVGFVDTSNKLYTQSLEAGDIFIFPKSLVHYQYNASPTAPATAIAAFGSASSGSVAVPSTIFATGVDDTILAKSFKTDVATIEKIKKGLASKA